MKMITFKTLSILLAVVILVAALPLAAFADGSITCRQDPVNGEHNYQMTNEEETCVYASNEYHLIMMYKSYSCIWCGKIHVEETPRFENHEFDDSVDEEVDMQGFCIVCERMIYW